MEEPKPDILVNGICKTSPELPCCEEMYAAYATLNTPGYNDFTTYPNCEPDGYYAPRQEFVLGVHCMDKGGKVVPGLLRVSAEMPHICIQGGDKNNICFFGHSFRCSDYS